MNESVSTLLNDLSKLILAIEDDCNKDPLWQRFYQIQMYSYLLSKKNFIFRIEEAEEVYDLISDSWIELKKYIDNPIFDIKNIDNIFKSTLIEFPVDQYTITDFCNNDDLIFGSI